MHRFVQEGGRILSLFAVCFIAGSDLIFLLASGVRGEKEGWRERGC